MRKLLIALLAVSILVLILVPLFVLLVWGAGMVVGSIVIGSIDGQLPETVEGPFAHFIGSPLFYVEATAAAAAVFSAMMLIFKKKR